MEHLYIIGNGFDVFTGLHTKYSDFKRWLELNFVFVYENMQAAYDMDGEWWNDFELQLGKLNVEKFVKRFSDRDRTLDDILSGIKKQQRDNDASTSIPLFNNGSPCASRLRGLLEVLQFCFERWVADCQKMISDPQYTSISKDDSFFINFNYTDVLEWLYDIPEENVLHIHGRASRHDRLIFGHNQYPFGSVISNYDVDQTCMELFKYEKNPYEYIFKHENLPQILCDIKHVHVYGFSLSPVDENYLDWIEKNTHDDCTWEFSWYTDLDKDRIDKFVLDHWRIKDRLTLMQLQPIDKDNI